MLPEMNPSASIAGRLSRKARVAIVWASAAAIALAAALAPPFVQPEAYHDFVDQRAMLGVPNFFNVVSNLAFLVVGVAGLHFVLRGALRRGDRAFQDPAERRAWGVVFAATALTCCGSWYYHLAPDSPRLAWDRLPMAIAFMGIVAAVVSERVSTKAGRRLLVPLCVLGAASVWYWRWSAAHGFENLNPYGAVQFGSALLILLMLALFPSRYTRSGDFLGAVIWYALAKLAEHFDGAIFAATGEIVSGHTLKHLLAAAAIFWLLRMLWLRVPTNPAALPA
jgi:Ceramidase